MPEHKLSIYHPIEWACIGNLPCNIASQLPQPSTPPVDEHWSGNTSKALNKWLKKQWELPVLVVIFPEDEQQTDSAVQLLHYLRETVRNGTTRLICFAPDSVRQQLMPDLWQLKIHHLHRLDELESSFVESLVFREWQEYLSLVNCRQRRNHELELLTFLARMNREADFSPAHIADLAELIQGLTQAQALLHIRKDMSIQGIHPAPLSVSPQWQVFAEQIPLHDTPADRPLLLNLNKQDSVHDAASLICGQTISASIIYPLRCYDQTNHYFIAFLDEDAIAQLDVPRLSLLEKTIEQVRTQLERQQSEERLKSQYQRLQNTLSRLHETQEQLYHSEKLSAVGQLAAGIAHEINNPVSFIMSNFEPLDEYIHTMSHMLKLHEEFATAMLQGDEMVGNQLRQQISREREAADLEFMLEDIYALVNDSRKGLKRVSEIVTNLRTFSRKDNLEATHFDLCECISSAVSLMRYQLNTGIEVHCELPAEAITEGNGGLLGQVIVNLVQNAVHALEDVTGPQLTLTLSQQDKDWILDIIDNGCGIPPEVKDKIFDPFFTTKEVGKGTGLGLSTVYSIIQRHKGNIEVSSQPGRTYFRIKLPAVMSD